MSQEIALLEFDEETFGPAMRALNDRQRLFVLNKVQLALSNKEAARASGYSDTHPKALDVAGHRLAHHPSIQAAILEECQKLMRSEGPKSIGTLVEIRDDKSAEAKDRIKCAVELMNRSGLHAVSESVTHRVEHLSEAEKDRRILALCAELGLSEAEANKMLISPLEAKRTAAGSFVVEPQPHGEDDTPEEWTAL